MTKEQIESQAAESSPYFPEGKHDRAYTEGFTDAGTRNNLKISELKLRIEELEKEIKFQAELICDSGAIVIENMELEKQVNTLESSNKILRDTLQFARMVISDAGLKGAVEDINEAFATDAAIRGEPVHNVSDKCPISVHNKEAAK